MTNGLPPLDKPAIRPESWCLRPCWTRCWSIRPWRGAQLSTRTASAGRMRAARRAGPAVTSREAAAA